MQFFIFMPTNTIIYLIYINILHTNCIFEYNLIDIMSCNGGFKQFDKINILRLGNEIGTRKMLDRDSGVAKLPNFIAV